MEEEEDGLDKWSLRVNHDHCVGPYAPFPGYMTLAAGVIDCITQNISETASGSLSRFSQGNRAEEAGRTHYLLERVIKQLRGHGNIKG